MKLDLRLEKKADSTEEEILSEVLEALRSIKYGSIQLFVQDGKVVQIEKVEKVRFPRPASGESGLARTP